MSNIQDTANQALQQMLTMAVNGLQGAVDFSKAQIPDVIHQMLMWEALKSLVMTLIAITFIIFSVGYLLKMYTSFNNKEDMLSNENGGIVACLGVVIVVSILGLQDNYDWLEIWLAPKYYLLQQAAHLIK